MLRNPYAALEKNLGYRFRRRQRLEAALTHRSFRHESGGEVTLDNQRLEFLGDAALGLAAAAEVYARHPDMDEGALTQCRSRLTGARVLAQVARLAGLGDHMRLGRGERMSGGAERDSLLEDAFEAVLGAAYEDGGLPAVQKILRKVLWPRLEQLAAHHGTGNPKGDLQEYCQRRWKRGPKYERVAQAGPAHARWYTVEARLDDRVLGRGEGPNLREAEILAAEESLARLRAEKPESA